MKISFHFSQTPKDSSDKNTRSSPQRDIYDLDIEIVMSKEKTDFASLPPQRPVIALPQTMTYCGHCTDHCSC